MFTLQNINAFMPVVNEMMIFKVITT